MADVCQTFFTLTDSKKKRLIVFTVIDRSLCRSRKKQRCNLIFVGPCLIVSLNDKLRLRLGEKLKIYMALRERQAVDSLYFSGSPQAAFNPHSSDIEAVDGKYSS